MHGKSRFKKFECNNCGEIILIDPESIEANIPDSEIESFTKDENVISKIANASRIVVTCAQNNTQVNHLFLDALEKYCDHNSAELVIIPIRYRKDDIGDFSYPDEIKQYLYDNIIQLKSPVRIVGNLKISPTATNPLSGLDPMSKGDTLIVGHPQVMLRTMPQHGDQYPSILSTTGTISEKNYIQSKVGYKAEFNHSMSAVVIEQKDEETFFIRHLNFDGEGFCDLGKYYTKNIVSEMETLGIVTGDEHAMFSDPDVIAATYKNEDSLVNYLKPKIIVRHDINDFASASHHHKNNIFMKYAKWKTGTNDVAAELDGTIDFINNTTPKESETWIVASNHNEHLLRWLNECDPKYEPWNARVYHYLMYKMLCLSDMTENGLICPDPFQLYGEGKFSENVKFIGRKDDAMIADVHVGYHGDAGVNGSRGSRGQFSILPTKTVIGHSHSPGINQGCYQVGTSSRLRLDYNIGPSSWHHAHCLIYANGKRQLVFIVNGEYRLK